MTQDYINSVEALAEEQKRELQRVRDEKKEIEKAVFRVGDGVGESKGPVLDFSSASISDLPPKLRMVFEENKARGSQHVDFFSFDPRERAPSFLRC